VRPEEIHPSRGPDRVLPQADFGSGEKRPAVAAVSAYCPLDGRAACL